MKILLTGGTGYIGSHTAVVLAQAGHTVLLLDNLSNSKRAVVDRLEMVIGRRPNFVQGDIRNQSLVLDLLKSYEIDSVVHFAGLKAVGESVASPLDYYHNNVYGSLCLLEAMAKAGVKRLVFSSSATVYGEPSYLPLDETHHAAPTNPYGNTKLQIEQMLSDLGRADPDWRVLSLRYFNPVGAHESGHIGEDPTGRPNNLMPYIAQVAAGRRPCLNVYGNDYPTPDGTGIRDYIHVMDLACGHLAALERLEFQQLPHEVINLGTGKGHSVLEVLLAFELASGKKINFEYVPRRPGDTAIVYANAEKSKRILEWEAVRNLDDMCQSAWRFQLSAMCDK